MYTVFIYWPFVTGQLQCRWFSCTSTSDSFQLVDKTILFLTWRAQRSKIESTSITLFWFKKIFKRSDLASFLVLTFIIDDKLRSDISSLRRCMSSIMLQWCTPSTFYHLSLQFWNFNQQITVFFSTQGKMNAIRKKESAIVFEYFFTK